MTNASSSEALSVMITTIGTQRRNLPIMSGKNSNGKNAAIVVSTVEVTGHITSLAPRTAASVGCIPCSRYA